MATAAFVVFAWAVSAGLPPRAPRPARAAQVNSYSTFGTVSYSAGSCGADNSSGMVSSPGIKKILKVSNTEIYVVGCFTDFAGVAAADYVAKWNGTVWSGLGSSADINAIVHDAVIYKGDLHIAGEFTDAGGDVAADMVARWSGSAWTSLPVTGGTNTQQGLGSPKDAAGDYAAALAVQENGAGTSDDVLIVGGYFYYGINNGTSGFQFANTMNLATWNGSAWGSLAGTSPFTSAARDYVVHDIEMVGANTYVSGFRTNNVSCSTTYRSYSFHKFNGSAWSRPITQLSCPSGFGVGGLGVYTMEAVGTKIYLGGNFVSMSGVASHLAEYDTATDTVSAFNDFAAQFGTGVVVRDIAAAGSQLFVAGSFPGVTGTSGGVARWTGSSWQGIGRNAPTVVNALLADMSYSGADSRILVASPGADIGGVTTADGLAALAVTAVSTLDSVSVSAGTLSPSFDPAVTSYTLGIPNASSSVDFTLFASFSGASIKRTNSFGTIALSSDTETLSVSVGTPETITFAVNGISGASTTTYSFVVTRAAPATTAAPTTAAPTTAAPTTAAPTTAAPTTAPPQGTVAPQTTAATTPAATTAPATTVALAASGSGSPVASAPAAPAVTTKKAATATAIAKYAGITVASGSRVSVKVAASSSKYCKVSGTSVKGVKAGSCRVTVTVTPKKGKAVSRTVTLKVT